MNDDARLRPFLPVKKGQSACFCDIGFVAISDAKTVQYSIIIYINT